MTRRRNSVARRAMPSTCPAFYRRPRAAGTRRRVAASDGQERRQEEDRAVGGRTRERRQAEEGGEGQRDRVLDGHVDREQHDVVPEGVGEALRPVRFAEQARVVGETHEGAAAGLLGVERQAQRFHDGVDREHGVDDRRRGEEDADVPADGSLEAFARHSVVSAPTPARHRAAGPREGPENFPTALRRCEASSRIAGGRRHPMRREQTPVPSWMSQSTARIASRPSRSRAVTQRRSAFQLCPRQPSNAKPTSSIRSSGRARASVRWTAMKPVLG